MLPLGASRNLRVVTIDRRDYGNSTKYTDAEVDDLRQGRQISLERLGISLAEFLIWFSEAHGIPKTSTDPKTSKRSGGIVISGWSAGSFTTLALTGQPNAISQEQYSRLAPYVRLNIMYGKYTVPMIYSENLDL